MSSKKYFPDLIRHVTSGPVVSMVWVGYNVVSQSNSMIGEFYPIGSKPGTIRGDFALEIMRSIVDTCNSVQEAERLIPLWFKPEEIFNYLSSNANLIYDL